MKKRFLCVVLLLAMGGAAAAQSQPLAQHPEVASAIRLWEAWLEAQMAYRQQPGISAGIVYDQELVWSRGFGFADVEKKSPATPQTNYRIASISKLFTATAILQLRDAGKLQLDDPVARHLPWFRLRRAADGPVVTIRHLLTHTSGLPRESDFPYWTDAKFPTREQLMARLAEQDAAYPPETRWKYSNLALALAGEIVAAVSGEPYHAYIEKHILAPLGMTATSVLVPPEHRARLATAYGRRMPDGKRELRPFMDTSGIAPAANLSSNVEDLARFAALQFRDGPAGGRQILRGSTLREMHRIHWLEPNWQSGWGLGFSVRRLAGRTLVGHGGSLAGYRTTVSLDTKEKIGVIVLTNSDDGDPGMYADKFFELVAPAIARAAAPPASPKQADPAWNAYAGLYRSPWGDSQVLILNGELVIINPTAMDVRGSTLKLLPAGPHTFRMEGENGGAAVGELAVFEMGADGKVARLKTGSNYTFPVR